MARPIAYPAQIEPLVQFVEETTPEHIIARTHDKLAAGTPVKQHVLHWRPPPSTSSRARTTSSPPARQ